MYFGDWAVAASPFELRSDDGPGVKKEIPFNNSNQYPASASVITRIGDGMESRTTPWTHEGAEGRGMRTLEQQRLLLAGHRHFGLTNFAAIRSIPHAKTPAGCPAPPVPQSRPVCWRIHSEMVSSTSGLMVSSMVLYSAMAPVVHF